MDADANDRTASSQTAITPADHDVRRAVVERGLAKAIALISSEGELADLEYDSLSDPTERARFRSHGARSLTFTTSLVRFEVQVEVVIDDRRVSGRIDPPHRRVTLRHPDHSETVDADAFGVFVFDPTPRGVIRLALPDTNPVIETAPFPI